MAYRSRGGLIVFANGNSGEDPRFAGEPSDIARLPTLANDPALEKGWITVGALDPNNPTQLTSYSQQCGSAMNYCMVAPGNVVFIDPKAKVVIVSALGQKSVLRDAFKLGASDFIVKPFDADALVHTLAQFASTGTAVSAAV